MILSRLSRRALVLSLGAFCLGIVTLTAATQAVAARRGWGIRARPAYRAPGTPTPAAPRPLPPTDSPLQEYPRPEPDPIFVPDGFVDSTRAHLPDQETVLRQIIEIRRQVRLDPEFRLLAGKINADSAKQSFEDCEDGSEDAFKQALETLNSGEYEWTVRKTTSGHDMEMVCRTERASPASGSTTLRNAARALEARANACEDAEENARADELREMARQLRLEARREE